MSANPTLSAVLDGLRQPLDDFSFSPLWFWNDKLEEDELVRQLEEMKDKGVDQVIIHPRVGIRVKYLSDHWFRLYDLCLETARRLGMRLWIYDEMNWPSGNADGRVLQAYPEGRARHIVLQTYTGHQLVYEPMAVVAEGDIIAALMVSPDRKTVTDISEHIVNYHIHFDPPTPEHTFHFILARFDKRNHPLALPYATDLLDPRVTEVFIDITHETYFKRYGKDFGGLIRGFFTDEPGMYNNLWNQQPGSLPWTPALLDALDADHGLDFSKRLPWLWLDHPLAAETRRMFWETVTRLFVDNFFRPIREWCEAHNVLSIGHLEWEEYFCTQVQYTGDFFAPSRELHMAGLDRIDLDFHKITEKIASSVEHTTPGVERTMSETFAISGWDRSLEGFRYILDWQYVRGVNFVVPHAFFYSIRGPRVRECPPSLFIQNTFWPHFRIFSDYTKRLGYLLTQGVLQTPVGVYYPIATARANFDPNDIFMPENPLHVTIARGCMADMDRLMLDATEAIEAVQSDFDIIDDDVLDRSSWRQGEIRCLDQRYRALVVIDLASVPTKIRRKIENWTKKGGVLLTLELPGAPKSKKLGPNHIPCDSIDQLKKTLLKHNFDNVRFARPAPTVRVMRREYADATVLMLSQEGDRPVSLSFSAPRSGDCLRLDCADGSLVRWPLNPADGAVSLKLLGGQSAVLIFTDKPLTGDFPPAEEPGRPVLKIDGPWSIEIAGKTRRGPLADWAANGHADFSGWATYRKTIELTGKQADAARYLTLGDVRDHAEVHLDGELIGVRVWRPFQVQLPPLAPGRHELEIRVANTPINAYEGVAKPSGLFGPVELRAARRVTAR